VAMWQHSVVCMYGVLCGDASWTQYKLQLPEDDLNRDRNMLERFKCF
jgi:hypothetical protein